MSLSLESMPLASYFFGSAGGLIGLFSGYHGGSTYRLERGEMISYYYIGFETIEKYKWHDPLTSMNRLVAVLGGTVAGTTLGTTIGVGTGWGLDLMVRTTFRVASEGLKTLTHLAQSIPETAAKMSSLSEIVAKKISEYSIPITIVAGAITPVVVLVLLIRR